MIIQRMKKDVSHPRWAESKENGAGVAAETQSSVFSATLLPTAEVWKQCKGLSMDEEQRNLGGGVCVRIDTKWSIILPYRVGNPTT